jgi:DNA-binding transcriptional regulator YdaS (Cro superfamily)
LIRAELRSICDSLNNERGTGAQTKLARLLGWHYTTLWRKLVGKSPITQSDALAIRQALVLVSRERAWPERTYE